MLYSTAGAGQDLGEGPLTQQSEEQDYDSNTEGISHGCLLGELTPDAGGRNGKYHRRCFRSRLLDLESAAQKPAAGLLILRFGPNVNLGNIPPEEILALEALRQGVRGDTLKKAYRDSRK